MAARNYRIVRQSIPRQGGGDSGAAGGAAEGGAAEGGAAEGGAAEGEADVELRIDETDGGAYDAAADVVASHRSGRPRGSLAVASH